jgi:radical SAM superfamily enzyme with C-terminal helix-hairpin-helix motif
LEYPLNLNRAPMRAIEALPGIGAKRAARIVRARPFATWEAFVSSLDDPLVAERVAPYVGRAG